MCSARRSEERYHDGSKAGSVGFCWLFIKVLLSRTVGYNTLPFMGCVYFMF